MSALTHATAWVAAHAAPLVAFAVAVAGGVAGRRGLKIGAAVGAAALLAGWAVMLEAALPRGIWAPHRGAEVLLGAATVSTALAGVLAWRGGRNRRSLLGLDAALAGWWVAHAGVSDADFWRVGFVTMMLAFWLGRVGRDEPMPGVAAGSALLGGLIVAQAGPVWLVASAVAAAGGAGMLLARAGALPAAPVAALIGAADLAGGRVWRGRVDGIDLACVSALLAPVIVPAVAQRFGTRIGAKGNRFLALVAAVGTAIGLSALVWLLRRAISG